MSSSQGLFPVSQWVENEKGSSNKREKNSYHELHTLRFKNRVAFNNIAKPFSREPDHADKEEQSKPEYV